MVQAVRREGRERPMAWDPRVGPVMSASSDPPAGMPPPPPAPKPWPAARPTWPARRTDPGWQDPPRSAGAGGSSHEDETTTFAPPPFAPGHPLEPLRGSFGTSGPGPSPWVPTPDAAIAPSKRATANWGDTSLGLSAGTAAGVSYLGWWLTGLLIYFNERQNWYVRFHALQSVLYTAALTIVSVAGYLVSSLLMDLFLATHQPVFQTLARGLAAATLLAVVLAWLSPLIAAWCGYRLRIPFLAPYAERYAAPLPDDAEVAGEA